MIYASKWRTDVLVHTSSNLALVLYLHFMISCFYDPCLTSSLSGPTVMLILFLRVIKNFYLHNNQFCWKKQKTLLKIIEGTLDHHSKTTSGKSIYIGSINHSESISLSSSLLTDCSIVLLFVSVLITSSQLETGLLHQSTVSKVLRRY